MFMKKIILSFFLLGGLLSGGYAQRNCGSMEHHQHLLDNNPGMIQAREQIEEQTRRFTKENSTDKVTGIVYTIPVVVHVVYRTAAENISDAQVQSQIDVLNEDFRLLNADRVNTPAFFAGLRSDVEIQFCLAKTDPNGAATTGITRTVTTRTSFGTNDAVKSASTSGKAAWNTAAYMNMWVCNIGGGILGYAQFPGGPASTDGVVIDYRYFGRNGTAVAPFNKGRTATHEVGHYLNLFHIWGDDGTACTGSDQVSDTPNQADENYGCPTYPTASCSNTSDMYMNYMDYTDDACMNMFSAGQATRMRALFGAGGIRASLATSNGCNTPNPGTCNAATGLVSSSVAQTSATVSWSAVSGAVSYNLEYKTAAATTWTIVNTTSTSRSLTGLTAATNYLFRVQTVCATGTSAYSSQASFTTLSSGTVTYCASKGNSVADEWIDRVSLSGLTRTSGADAGYLYYTTVSANVNAGSSYSLGYSAGMRTGYSATEFWRVWIDWNQNGVFTDAGELVISRSSTSKNNLSTTITVPATAKNGTTRMRVSMKYNSAQTSSCETFSYGEVEDYNVVVSGGTARVMDPALASEEAPVTDVELFPNPANDRITLFYPEIAWHEGATVVLVDMQGKTWVREPLTSQNNDLEKAELNVENLPNGLYNLIIFAQDVKVSKKVQILHP
jgi:hypothetical protein